MTYITVLPKCLQIPFVGSVRLRKWFLAIDRTVEILVTFTQFPFCWIEKLFSSWKLEFEQQQQQQRRRLRRLNEKGKTLKIYRIYFLISSFPASDCGGGVANRQCRKYSKSRLKSIWSYLHFTIICKKKFRSALIGCKIMLNGQSQSFKIIFFIVNSQFISAIWWEIKYTAVQ